MSSSSDDEEEKGREVIRACLAHEDPMSLLPAFRSFKSRDGRLDVDLEYRSSASARSNAEAAWMYDLLERNMKAMYASTWGWNEDEKRGELDDPEARFFVATGRVSAAAPGDSATDAAAETGLAATREPLGYLHVRYTEEEDGVLALYVYEIQVEPRAAGMGLGRFMMIAAELAARKLGLGAVRLTVFMCNEPAIKFYLRLNYKPHEVGDDFYVMSK
jgi:ribosomal protein S18 acetylase RimI-like enzyme